MIPASFVPFFSISAGAAASLIGLLFVAVSVAPARTVGKDAPISRRSVAENAFTALLNTFLVSLIALAPSAPLSLGVLAITGGTILSSVRSLVLMLGRRRKEPSFTLVSALRQLVLPLSMLVIYVLEFKWGVDVFHLARLNDEACGALATILITLEGLAIVRSWELIGAQRNNIFAWIGALDEPDEGDTTGAAR